MIYETTTTIDAEPQAIWALLTDAASYATWNSTVDKVDGTIALGNKITVHATISPGRAFPVKVSTLTSPTTMVWTGGMPLGLFKGERTFTLTPTPSGGTQFQMREVFSGPMLGLIKRSMPDLTDAFNTFAADLKTAAESQG